MRVRIEYINQWENKVALGESARVYSDRIKPGLILKVHCCYAYVPERAQGDLTIILIEVGGREIVVRARAEDLRQRGVSSYRPFLVGENNRIIAYAPDAVEGDTIQLNVIGEMIPLKKWRKGKV